MASPTAPTKATEPKRARPSGGGWAVGRCCTLFSVGCVAATVAAIASVLAAPLGQHWMRDRSLDGTVDELPYALTYAHNASDAPPASASRSRRADFPRSKSFFQWWNFLVYDAETRDHFTIVYSYDDYAEGAALADKATVGMMHLRGSEHVSAASEIIPLDQLRVTNDFDLEYQLDAPDRSGMTTPHTLKVVDDGEYRIVGSFPDQGISWDLVVTRVHGYYGSEDGEQAQTTGYCAATSTLFGYHSKVTGVIREGDVEYDITDAQGVGRFRAYAAGSWGCALPEGPASEDPVNYPWSWAWLVLPATDAHPEVGMVWGTGRFGFGFPIGAIEGGYSVIGIEDKVQWSQRATSLLHNTSFEFLMQASTSHGEFRVFEVERSEWATFRDDVGEARLPLRQRFHARSSLFDAVVDFHSEVGQYFRLPAVMENEHGTKVFSDFRAVGVRAHVVITEASHRGGGGGMGSAPPKVLVDAWTDKTNALEFAYAAPVDVDALVGWLETMRG